MDRQATFAALERAVRRAPRLAVVLDYDGTLVPFAQAPEEAAPDPDLLRLLAAVAARPQTTVHLVSGRPRDVLADWVGHLPIWLWAEHGAFLRRPAHDAWEPLVTIPSDWLDKVWPALEEVTAAAPGSLLERKSAAVAWHYRNVPPDIAAEQAGKLRRLAASFVRRGELEIVEGSRVIEVRLPGVSKAVVGRYLASLDDDGLAVLAIGDDQTDDDLFAALPDSSLAVAVGTKRSLANGFLEDYQAVRDLLRTLVSNHGQT